MATDKQKKYTEELYEKITPYLVGLQATQETIDKAHSIYDIEKERQAKRDAEKEKAKSDAGVYIASKDPNMFHPGSPTPSSQIENIDTRGAMHPGSDVYIPEEPKGLNRVFSATPTAEVSSVAPTSEVKTEAAWLSDYVNNYLKKPITPEEEARRERAARAVQGVAGLGNVITAFSNLAFTGKGAPSQTLPTQQADAMGKEVTSWQDKLASEREKYAAAMLGAKTQKWKMEQEERKYADQLKQQGIENTIKLGNLEISRAKLAHDMDYAKQMLDLRAKELIQNGEKADQAFAQAMKELDLRKDQLQLSRDELTARQDGSYYSKSGSTGKAPTYLDVNGTTMRYNEDALTDAASMQAANILGLGDETKSPTQARMMVGAALNNKDPKMSEEDKKKIADVTEYLIGVGAIAAESKGNGEKKLGLNKKTISWDEQ